MPSWVKVLLAILALFVLVGAVGAFFAVRWLRGEVGELRTQAESVQREADAFGRGRDEEACIAESLARVDRCDGIVCQAKTRAFLSRCLTVANVSPDFCARVPRMREFTAAAKWPIEECARRGRTNDQRCMQLLGAIPQYCDERRSGER